MTSLTHKIFIVTLGANVPDNVEPNWGSITGNRENLSLLTVNVALEAFCR